MDSKALIELTEKYGAHNYAPLEVVISSAQGSWVQDLEGKRYLDMLSGYSALNFGHAHPRLLAVAHAQLEKLTMTSRAFFNDQFGPFCKELAEYCGMEMVLAMNSGAEAVETSLKLARRWGYQEKGVAEDQAEIICFHGNFHGRTTTIISFSTDSDSRASFGPFTPGFKIARYGDIADVQSLVSPKTVAVLFEPIQGEGGVIIPTQGFAKQLSDLCSSQKILLIADEVQTGFGRTGARFCCDHENVEPDLYVLGKSLGGGIVPISAVVGPAALLGLFTPGSHGSTFGGNPFACAIAREVLLILQQERLAQRSAELGVRLLQKLQEISSPLISQVRGKGLFVGMDVVPSYGPAKKLCKALKSAGLLCKDTRKQTVRFAPPLTTEASDLDWAIERIKEIIAKEEKALA